MPTLISSEEHPTFLEKPDMRFATTFLSINNRDYAVNGESLQDKTTGEIFTKRLDGRVVSFFQNKKYNYDLCLELRILLTTNSEFYYDRTSNVGYYVNTDFDHMSLFGERRGDILLNDSVFPNVNPGEDEDEHNPGNINVTDVRFLLSNETNGFFFRVTSRDSDKAFIEFLTTEYNRRFKDYEGSDEFYNTEAAMFVNEKWEDSNAAVEYTVEIVKGEHYKVYTVTDYIRFNEKCCIMLPMQKIVANFPNGYDSALVTIKAVTYDKIRTMVNNKEVFGEDFINTYNKLVPFDRVIPVDYYNLSYFVDDASDIILTDASFIVSMLDIPYVKRYMGKIAELKNSGSVFLSTKRPSDDDWVANSVWAERVRDITSEGKVINYDTETNILALSYHPYFDFITAEVCQNVKDLEKFAIDDHDVFTVAGEIQTDINDTDDFYFGEGLPLAYTKEEFDRILAAIGSDLNHRVRNIVTISDENGNSTDDVDLASVNFDTVSTSESDE
jgi:hypothetical protein